jgi:hypothetical protein
MFLKEEYRKIARRFVAVLTDQVQKLLSKPKDVDLYFNPEEIISELMLKSHREGYEKGKKEMLDVLNEFNDTSKDPKEN